MKDLSHLVGAGEPASLEHTIGEAMDMVVRRWPHAEALVSVHQGVRLTWSPGRASRGLRRRPVRVDLESSDRVGVGAPNCAEWTIAQFATARAGMVQANITAYRRSKLAWLGHDWPSAVLSLDAVPRQHLWHRFEVVI